MNLCFDSQGDRPEIAGERVLALLLLMAEYKEEDEYYVVDVDAIEEWDPTTQFKDLLKVKMTTNPQKPAMEGIP